ncbi:MAG: hypothetical protein AMS17_13475 [Spirochaetes bacterium DG_61]|nr:MAG: hypothetical protein AMS17_13475 [Spirochaetes bacterium DG_61]
MDFIRRLKNQRDYKPYLYILPSIILLIFVFFYPLIQNLYRSFFRFAGGKAIFFGLNNYKYLLLRDTIARRAFLNNLTLLLIVPIFLILSILFAVLITERIRFRGLYQTTIIIPYIISIVAAGVVFSRLLRFDGIINFILDKAGLDLLIRDWLGDPKLAIFSVMSVIVWKELPFGIVLFIAGISNINPEIYEAAKIDGANWWQNLFYITIPQLKSVINFYVVYNVMVIFAWIFTYVYVLTQGGPINATTILELRIFNLAFKEHNMGMASALAMLLFLMIFVFVYLQFRLRQETLEES